MSVTDKKKPIWIRPIPLPRPVNRLFRFLLSRKMLRFYLFSFACLATLILAFYTIENFRASFAFSKHVKQLKAQGISVDYKDYIPPEIPNDENLAKIPMFAAFEHEWEPLEKKRFPWDKGKTKWKDETFGILPSLSVYHKASKHTAITYGTDDAWGNWNNGTTMDFSVWQIYYRGTNSVDIDLNQSLKLLLDDPRMIDVWNRTTTPFPFPEKPGKPAIDVLIALKKFDPIWKELIQASFDRPQVRFPLHYDEFYGCLLPHLSYIKSIHQYGKLRTTAELHSGKPQEGTESIRFMLQMVEGIQSEAFLISYLVRIADFHITMHPLWEGVTHHLFRKEDLEILAHQLSQMSFIPQVQRALAMERAVHVAEIDRVAKHRAYFDRLSNLSEMEAQDWPFPWTYHSYLYLAPKGWIRRNVLAYSEDLTGLEKILKSWREGKVDALIQYKQSIPERSARPVTVYNALSRSWTFNDENILAKALRAEATVRIAKTAVALERFHLNHSTYPASLSELIPQFLPEVPLDPIDFELLRYQRTQPDQFQLYSIGWNEADDGGEFAQEYKKGDWVWQWPVDSRTK